MMEPLSAMACRSCRIRFNGTTQSRSFSTSLARSIIPPESPHYVDVPSSYQSDLPYQRPQKGILPVPRELFPAKRPDKPSQKYLENVTKDSLPKNVIPEAKLSEAGKHRARMAEIRKQHLREGLTDLYKRKQSDIRAMTARSHAKQSERARLLSQAEREDARLTSVSIPASMRPDQSKTNEAIVRDAAIAKRMYATKVENHARAIAAKKEARLDNLHTLYMNARHFITTEEQLNEAIAEQFDREDIFKNDTSVGDSMWNFGPPDSIRDLVNISVGKQSVSSTVLDVVGQRNSEDNPRIKKSQERFKKIAEKLSGGKI